MSASYRQLDIWWVDLEPVKVAETRKKRPCLILQADNVNKNSRTILVAPILPEHKDWPFAVNVTPTKLNGIDKNRHVNIKQLRVIDISRIGKMQGRLEQRYVSPIEDALRIVFGIF